MQKFVNNWSAPLELAPGVTSWEVDLPDGDYTITFSDSLALTATRWEIVGAAVLAGVATLARGQQGTTDQDWPAGCVAYQAVTVGLLEELLQSLADQQLQITDLLTRVAALEGGAVPPDALTDSTGQVLTDSAAETLTGVAA